MSHNFINILIWLTLFGPMLLVVGHGGTQLLKSIWENIHEDEK